MVDADVYDGTRLGSGALLAGPAVVELANTTIIAPHGLELGVDRFGQTGNLEDLYRAYRLDVDAIVEAAAELFLD